MITIIAAVAKNNVIGFQGRIPWHLPQEFKHFKETTQGNVVVMGRKTFESLPAKFKPLPNRVNIVVSSSMPETPKVVVCKDYETAIRRASEFNKEVFIIGGSTLYKQALENADRMLLSIVELEPEGDAFFPAFSEKEWVKASETQRNGFKLVEYSRKKA